MIGGRKLNIDKLSSADVNDKASPGSNPRFFIWSLVLLEALYAVCALGIIAYRVMGRFDVVPRFGLISYRTFNLVVSLLIVVYLIRALLKSQTNVLVLVTLFSLFHFVEGIIIHFWYKVVIHFVILILVAYHYFRHRMLALER